MSPSSHRWWKVAMGAFIAIVFIGGGLVLYEPPMSDRREALGLNLLVIGNLGLVISALGAWITRR